MTRKPGRTPQKGKRPNGGHQPADKRDKGDSGKVPRLLRRKLAGGRKLPRDQVPPLAVEVRQAAQDGICPREGGRNTTPTIRSENPPGLTGGLARQNRSQRETVAGHPSGMTRIALPNAWWAEIVVGNVSARSRDEIARQVALAAQPSGRTPDLTPPTARR